MTMPSIYGRHITYLWFNCKKEIKMGKGTALFGQCYKYYCSLSKAFNFH
jgi:hypothetical protein